MLQCCDSWKIEDCNTTAAYYQKFIKYILATSKRIRGMFLALSYLLITFLFVVSSCDQNKSIYFGHSFFFFFHNTATMHYWNSIWCQPLKQCPMTHSYLPNGQCSRTPGPWDSLTVKPRDTRSHEISSQQAAWSSTQYTTWSVMWWQNLRTKTDDLRKRLKQTLHDCEVNKKLSTCLLYTSDAADE